MLHRIKTRIRNYLDELLTSRLDSIATNRIDDLAKTIITEQLPDLERSVSSCLNEIDWSEHIDYASLSYHIDLDLHELARHIDANEVADELIQRIHVSIR